MNGLKTSIKDKNCQSGSKKTPSIYCVQEAHFKYKDWEVKSKAMEKDVSYYTNQKEPGQKKKAGIAI